MKAVEITLGADGLDALSRFEAELDPANPEAGSLSPRILGYGEMSTVFAFDHAALKGLAFKRMAVFESESEIEAYQKNYRAYHLALANAGIFTPDYGCARGRRGNKPILYAFQRMLDPARIAHRYIQTCSAAEASTLFAHILERFRAVFARNQETRGQIELGLDGQISNWALLDDNSLVYLDTSTPLMRLQGVEQLDPELFLRVCPSYLVWIIRLFFLKDVLNRYYDLRLVIIDLIANLHKEKKKDLIEPFLSLANSFLQEHFPAVRPIVPREIDAYYSEDARIWRIFLAFRRLERTVKTRIQKKEYALILPGRIDR